MEDVKFRAEQVAKLAIDGVSLNLGLVISGNQERVEVYRSTLLSTLQEEIYRLQNEIYFALNKGEKLIELGNLNFQLLRIRTIQEIIKCAK